jgi:hypothetical protein
VRAVSGADEGNAAREDSMREAANKNRKDKAAPEILIRDAKSEDKSDLGNVLTLTVSDYRLDLEKAIRSVAYLLEWSSCDGNQPVDGNAACGLHYLLHQCADELHYFHAKDDIYKAGGDPSLLLRHTAKRVQK